MQRVLSAPVLGQSLSVTRERAMARFNREQRLIAGNGISLSRGPNGTLIELSGQNGVGCSSADIFPWKVRWFGKSATDDTDGEWQVYAPIGTLVVNYGSSSSVRRSYAAMCSNGYATNENGDVIYGWFKIPTPEDSDAEITTGEMAAKSWSVRAYIKPWARYKVMTGKGSYGATAWTETVATISEIKYKAGENNRTEHTVSQSLASSLTKLWDTSSPFSVDYELTSETVRESSYTVKVINQTKMLGRLQKENAQPFDIKSADGVWVKIKHETTEFDLTLAVTDQGQSDDDKTVYKIYEMDGDVVKTDNRSSIGTLPFYTNPADTGSSSAN